MSDASEKRALDSKAITDKEGAKAETETDLESNKESEASKSIANSYSTQEGTIARPI